MINDYTDRHYPFDACFNFRDIGGYPTADGRTIRWGRYFRAGRQDRMTPSDLEKVRALGIATQVDLRSEGEVRDQSRGPLPSMGASYEHLPVISDGGREQLNRLVGDTGISGQRYLGYLDFGRASWLRMFELFANAQRQPILIHCTAGKDRTGVTTAFLLSVLGVDRTWIEADYLLTNRDVERQVEFLTSSQDLPEGMTRDAFQRLASVPETAMRDFLDGIQASWGGPLDYLRSIGISDDIFEAVRDAFLQP